MVVNRSITVYSKTHKYSNAVNMLRRDVITISTFSDYVAELMSSELLGI